MQHHGVPILLIEDDEDDYVLTRSLLEEAGPHRFEVRWIATYDAALQAIETLADDPPAAVLVDYRLGARNGLDLIRAATERGCTCPFILLTGQGDHDVDVAASRAGAADYLAKHELNSATLERAIRYAVERKRREIAIRESQERLELALKGADLGMYDWNVQTGEVTINDRYAEMLGYTVQELQLTLDRWQELIHPDDWPAERGNLERQLADNAPVESEYRMRARSGEWRWVLDRGRLVARDRHGRPLRVIGTLLDITEHKHQDEALRRQELILQHMTDGINVAGRDGVIVFTNPAFDAMFGYERGELIGRHVSQLNDLDRAQAEQLSQHIFQQVETACNWVGEIRCRRKDGSPFVTRSHISGMEIGGQLYTVAVQEDITELQRAQEEKEALQAQLLQAQKMEAIGQLTAGIAHDFNNMLTVINGFAELLQQRMPPEDPLQAYLKRVRYAGQRAADLVRQLLAFSRKQVLQPQTLDLNAAVNSLCDMLRRMIGEDILLTTNLGAGLWPVKVDPQQLQQIVTNLAVNARDAMPQGGRLIIETANVTLDERYAARHIDVQPGEYVRLQVSDTGCGISAEVQARIFEPFFTTKAEGKGTGLGLATVYGIVSQSGGHIEVRSEVGHGATFTIYLPRAPEEGEVRPGPGTGPLPALACGDETILLAEDDAAVCEYTRRALEAQGYTVLEAADGAEAIRIAADHAGPIDLLISDVVMPEMRGSQLAAQLRKDQPGLKVLFMSGYTDAIMRDQHTLDANTAFLQKPFGVRDLLEDVRRLLNGNR
jgi:PAS domain S-box-containing protein